MKKGSASCLWIVGAFLLLTPDPVSADTIFRIDSKGKETMVADGVIIWAVNGNKANPHSIQYYFGDIRKQHLEIENEFFQVEQGEKARWVYSPKEQRERILDTIKAKGIRVKITNVKNVSTDSLLFQIGYGFPQGYAIIGGVPRGENILNFKPKGQSVLEKIPFSNLKLIEFIQDENARIVMKNGKERQGRWEVPEIQGKRLSAVLLGLNNENEVVHTELEDVIKIEFVEASGVK